MKRIQKRLMALVLAAIMVMGMLPMSVFAAEGGDASGDTFTVELVGNGSAVDESNNLSMMSGRRFIRVTIAKIYTTPPADHNGQIIGDLYVRNTNDAEDVNSVLEEITDEMMGITTLRDNPHYTTWTVDFPVGRDAFKSTEKNGVWTASNALDYAVYGQDPDKLKAYLLQQNSGDNGHSPEARLYRDGWGNVSKPIVFKNGSNTGYYVGAKDSAFFSTMLRYDPDTKQWYYPDALSQKLLFGIADGNVGNFSDNSNDDKILTKNSQWGTNFVEFCKALGTAFKDCKETPFSAPDEFCDYLREDVPEDARNYYYRILIEPGDGLGYDTQYKNGYAWGNYKLNIPMIYEGWNYGKAIFNPNNLSDYNTWTYDRRENAYEYTYTTMKRGGAVKLRFAVKVYMEDSAGKTYPMSPYYPSWSKAYAFTMRDALAASDSKLDENRENAKSLSRVTLTRCAKVTVTEELIGDDLGLLSPGGSKRYPLTNKDGTEMTQEFHTIDTESIWACLVNAQYGKFVSNPASSVLNTAAEFRAFSSMPSAGHKNTDTLVIYGAKEIDPDGNVSAGMNKDNEKYTTLPNSIFQGFDSDALAAQNATPWSSGTLFPSVFGFSPAHKLTPSGNTTPLAGKAGRYAYGLGIINPYNTAHIPDISGITISKYTKGNAFTGEEKWTFKVKFEGLPSGARIKIGEGVLATSTPGGVAEFTYNLIGSGTVSLDIVDAAGNDLELTNQVTCTVTEVDYGKYGKSSSTVTINDTPDTKNTATISAVISQGEIANFSFTNHAADTSITITKEMLGSAVTETMRNEAVDFGLWVYDENNQPVPNGMQLMYETLNADGSEAVALKKTEESKNGGIWLGGIKPGQSFKVYMPVENGKTYKCRVVENGVNRGSGAIAPVVDGFTTTIETSDGSEGKTPSSGCPEVTISMTQGKNVTTKFTNEKNMKGLSVTKHVTGSGAVGDVLNTSFGFGLYLQDKDGNALPTRPNSVKRTISDPGTPATTDQVEYADSGLWFGMKHGRTVTLDLSALIDEFGPLTAIIAEQEAYPNDVQTPITQSQFQVTRTGEGFEQLVHGGANNPALKITNVDKDTMASAVFTNNIGSSHGITIKKEVLTKADGTKAYPEGTEFEFNVYASYDEDGDSTTPAIPVPDGTYTYTKYDKNGNKVDAASGSWTSLTQATAGQHLFRLKDGESIRLEGFPEEFNTWVQPMEIKAYLPDGSTADIDGSAVAIKILRDGAPGYISTDAPGTGHTYRSITLPKRSAGTPDEAVLAIWENGERGSAHLLIDYNYNTKPATHNAAATIIAPENGHSTVDCGALQPGATYNMVLRMDGQALAPGKTFELTA